MKLTIEDVAKLIAIVKVHYSFSFKNFTSADFDILMGSWYEDLKKYPRDLVGEAFSRAKAASKISLTTADIIEEISKIQAAFSRTEPELWQELISHRAHGIQMIECFRYTYIEANGRSQGENARNAFAALYANMRPELQRYCGNAAGFQSLCVLDEEQIEFERARFRKEIRRVQEQEATRQELPQLAPTGEPPELPPA